MGELEDVKAEIVDWKKQLKNKEQRLQSVLNSAGAGVQEVDQAQTANQEALAQVAKLGKTKTALNAKVDESMSKMKEDLQSKMKQSLITLQAAHKEKFTQMTDVTKKLKAEAQQIAKDAAVKNAQAEKAGVVFQALQDSVDELEAKHKENELKLAELTELANKADDTVAKAEEMGLEVEKANAQLEDTEAKLAEERTRLKAAMVELEDLKGTIRVYCRCRPLMHAELAREENGGKCDELCVKFPDQYTVALMEMKDVGLSGEKKLAAREFVFDRVFTAFTPGAGSQEKVFEETRTFATLAAEGINACVFAYGQTGSGKTWTMQGNVDQPGLKPRMIQEVYDIADRTKDTFSYRICFYMVEVYMGALKDLIWKHENDPKPTKHNREKIAKLKKKGHQDPPKLTIQLDKRGVTVIQGALVRQCDSSPQMLKEALQAEGERVLRKTKMNPESSRGHMIFGMSIYRLNKYNGKKTAGKLSLIDLAGSEKASKTGASTGDDMYKEGVAINISLGELIGVIGKIKENQENGVSKDNKAGKINYRNNKLTHIMQDSLGGKAKTLMFVNISPSEYNLKETENSLSWALVVKQVKNEVAEVNHEAESAEMAVMREEMSKLQEELAKWQAKV